MKGPFRLHNITSSPYSSSYDPTHRYLIGYSIDLLRKTAVLLRQSTRGANYLHSESRFLQEGLVTTAVEIREDHDASMIIECDEGSGISGQKKIYERPKLLELWQAIQDGLVGSIIVAREDRLFRDRFLTQATQFAEECAKRGVLLIVAGRRCYDFRITDDFKAFMEKMQESYGYIDTHVRYMKQAKMQKLHRGGWIGTYLPAPLVMGRLAMQQAKERLKEIHTYGGDAQMDTFVLQAARPVIYLPWQDRAIDLFQKFKLFDFSSSRLGRYIEDKHTLFPFPSVEDLHHFLFHIRMKQTNTGYTFTSTGSFRYWMTNLALAGYAYAGKNESGTPLFIEDAFDAAIPRDLFEECYSHLTGIDLAGNPQPHVSNNARFVRQTHHRDAALLTRCFHIPDLRINTSGKYYVCITALKDCGPMGKRQILWRIPVLSFDQQIIARLTDLAQHDHDLARRVEQFYDEFTKGHANEQRAILEDIVKLEQLIARFDQLLTNPARPLSQAQEERYLLQQQEAEQQLAHAQRTLKRQQAVHLDTLIPDMYRILGKLSSFGSLDSDKQRKMLRLLIEQIELRPISPHLFALTMKWKDPVSLRLDCALVWRGSLSKVYWEDEDDTWLREHYPSADPLVLLQRFPDKSHDLIIKRASFLKVKRLGRGPWPFHLRLSWSDWINACRCFSVDPSSDEGASILAQLNRIASSTGEQMVSLWWLLPASLLTVFDEDGLKSPSIHTRSQ